MIWQARPTVNNADEEILLESSAEAVKRDDFTRAIRLCINAFIDYASWVDIAAKAAELRFTR